MSGGKEADGNSLDNGQHENNGASGGGVQKVEENQPATAPAGAAAAEQQRSSGGGSSGNTDNVCRDFLNNVCFRGSRCKYYHPPEMGGANEPKKEEFRFCNDFQNRGCFRENCRYVHCARADVDEYEQTGRMSESLAKAIVAVTGQDQVAGRPLCKEFLSGNCSRGGRCRFWHINPREERERRTLESASGPPAARAGNRPVVGGGGQFPFPAGPTGRRPDSAYWSYAGGHGNHPHSGSDYDHSPAGLYDPFDYNGGARREAKRPRFEVGNDRMAAAPRPRSISPTAYSAVLEENAALRRKIDMLKQTLSDVTASNDTLMAENARLRAKTATKAAAAAVTDQAIAAASMASAAAINSVLSSSVAGLNPQALVAPAGSGLTPAEHLAVVSLAAAGQQPMVVQPSLETDGVRWSFSQMGR